MTGGEYWFSEIEAQVFTSVKSRITKTFEDDYPTIFCTSSNQINAEPQFPALYLHELSTIERGRDLYNDGVNAVSITIQIDVTSNTDREDVRRILSEAVAIMKSLRFNVTSMPIYSTRNGIEQGVARFRRIYGYNDTFIT